MKDDEYWEFVDVCNYCGGTDYTRYMRSNVPNWFRKEPLTLDQCDKCGLIHASPRPNPLTLYSDFLSGGENSVKTVERKLNRPNVMKVHTKAVETALSFANGDSKKLYDMGCGAGTILEAAKALGLEAEGNDVNLAAINRLRELGFNAHHGFTKDVELPSENFDIVINFDYIEHTYEPFEDLIKCNEILKDDGILYLKTLYMDCPHHIMKKDGYQLFGSGHFYYYPVRTLCSMVHSAGFDIIDLKTGNLVFIVAKKTRKPSKDLIGHYDFEVIDSVA